MRNWLPLDVPILDEAALARRGRYQPLRADGAHLRIAEQRIGARPATAEEAGRLRERKGAPLLTVERTSYDGSGRAVECGPHAHRADRCSFELTSSTADGRDR